MAFADPKTWRFDYPAEIAAAIAMFPPLREQLFFVEVHQQKPEAEIAFTCHGPAWEPHKNIPEHVAVVRRAAGETLMQRQPRAVRSVKYPDVKFIVLYFAHQPRAGSDMAFVFDHQIGHHLVYAGSMLTRGDEFVAESGADAFAAIRFMQRFGRENGKLLLAQKSADRMGSPAGAGHYQGEWRQLTASVLLRVVKDADVAEFETLDPYETVEMADYIGQQYPPSELPGPATEKPALPTEKELAAAAEAGGGEDQYALAARYMHGAGVPQDFQKALSWYKRAAETGHIPSQHLVGFAYHHGVGAPQDYAKAMAWYAKAAEQGFPGSEWAIGMMHQFGDGVPADAAKAAEWFRRAADKGDPGAAYALGLLYRDGNGVAKDAAEWERLCKRAANAGYKAAQFAIAETCADKMEEAEWLFRAARQGHDQARARLIDYLDSGRPLPPAVAAGTKKLKEEEKKATGGS